MGVDVTAIERAAVGGVVVHGGEGRRGAAQFVYHAAAHPRDVPAGGRIAQLRLRAPAVGGGDAERQATVESRRVDPHTTENVQVAQGPLTLGDPRRVVAVPGIDQQGAA